MKDILLRELGDLTPEARRVATEFFADLLTNLGATETALKDPGPFTPRERILGYLEQISPGLIDSDHGPALERAINALLLYVQDACSPGTSSAR